MIVATATGVSMVSLAVSSGRSAPAYLGAAASRRSAAREDADGAGGTGPSRAPPFAERIVGRAELAALPPEFKDQLRVELGSKKLKSHVAGKRAAEDSSAWLRRHRAAIDADEEAAVDEATERLDGLMAWPRPPQTDFGANRTRPPRGRGAPTLRPACRRRCRRRRCSAASVSPGFEASVTSLVGQTISEFGSVHLVNKLMRHY